MKIFKKSDDLTKVNEYYDAYYAWFKQTLHPDPDADTQTSTLATLKGTLDTAEDALPEAADKKILNAAATTELNFKKFKETKIDPEIKLNEKCQAEPAGDTHCDEQDIPQITKDYLIAEGAYDKKKATEDSFANVVKSATDKIDKHTFATMTTCDATAGIVHKEYDTEKCEGTPEVEFKAQWGACVQAPDGENFIKVTGAAALQAAAIAVVAFAGSQF